MLGCFSVQFVEVLWMVHSFFIRIYFCIVCGYSGVSLSVIEMGSTCARRTTKKSITLSVGDTLIFERTEETMNAQYNLAGISKVSSHLARNV